MAVQADEFRDLRARAISSGNVPDVARSAEVLANILQRTCWKISKDGRCSIRRNILTPLHFKQAAEIAPAETPAWRTALWHLGAALEQSGQKEQALEAYIKSYRAGPSDPFVAR